MKEYEYDLAAIGGGTAGLVAAAGASYLGARAAIIESHALGGDCLWTGCVPSKALIASARAAHAMRHAEALGLKGASPDHAFREVMARTRGARATVAHHDDPARFREMGVDVHFGTARFTSPGTIDVEGVGRIRSDRIVVATGAHASVPPIPGLQEAGFLTHATAFEQDDLPESMVILGAGPVGLEFAQIYARLGARVTVVERLPRILPGEDAEAAEVLTEILEGEGINLLTGVEVARVDARGGKKALVAEGGEAILADQVFVATGRRPSTAGLELDRAGVATDGAALKVDETLRTTARGVWGAGDVTGGPQFTHAAEYMAKTALRNALFPFASHVDYLNVPRVTYTDPEVAHVGLTQEQAAARGAETYRYEFSDLDRAIADGDTRGFVKIHADGNGKILGATLLGGQAGELIFPLVMARAHGIPLSGLADTIFPYPTRMEGLKRAANAYQRSRLEGLGGRVLRRVVSWLT